MEDFLGVEPVAAGFGGVVAQRGEAAGEGVEAGAEYWVGPAVGAVEA
ncbi:hypothetical protein [Streptomyces huiliensis]|nr:hypothetical protein [Streptomyces huiliensis]MBZ4318661.1 hypothetical protein [Streptomyces huiliensis]